jgi:hypothetical protein
MRSIPYQAGERLASATESFGRIARCAPVDVPPAPLQIILDRGVKQHARRTDAAAYDAYFAARVVRSRQIGATLARALRWLNEHLIRYLERHRRHALERATVRALMRLDSRTLRDLGMHHSELAAVAREVGRNPELRGLHAIRAANGLRLF